MVSSKQKYIVVILGARPNFIKATPFFREAKKHPEFRFTLIHTGQHFDPNMSQVFFEELDLPKPDIYLDVKGQYHTEKIGKMFDSLKRVFSGYEFDACVVFGDVNSTLAGAIATTKNHCKLIHIEAGLRSHDRRMPEEINRCVVDHLSDLLFTTETAANENLRREGIREEKIKLVGNIMIDSLDTFWEKIQNSNILEVLHRKPKSYAVVTVHRQENIDHPGDLKKILTLLSGVNQDVPLVFPLHPGTKKMIEAFGFLNLLDGIQVIEPLGYFEFMKLVAQSLGVITDSGGIQDETSHLGVPCATLRDNTERPVTLALGSNKLFPIDTAEADEMKNHLQRSDFRSRHIPLWDGKVTERIFKELSLHI